VTWSTRTLCELWEGARPTRTRIGLASAAGYNCRRSDAFRSIPLVWLRISPTWSYRDTLCIGVDAETGLQNLFIIESRLALLGGIEGWAVVLYCTMRVGMGILWCVARCWRTTEFPVHRR
jgi:hypothetical protein